MLNRNIESSHREGRRPYQLFGMSIYSPMFCFLALAYVWWLTHGPWFFMSLVVKGPRLAHDQLDPMVRAHSAPAWNQLSDATGVLWMITCWGASVFGLSVVIFVFVNGIRLMKLGGKDRTSGMGMIILSTAAFLWSIFHCGYFATWYSEPGRFGPTDDPDHDSLCQPVKSIKNEMSGDSR